MAFQRGADNSESLAKAKAARAAKTAAHRALNLRRDFADRELWASLASERGIRLPSWTEPPTPARMKLWLRRLNVAIADYRAWSGERTWTQFQECNPAWPIAAWLGLVLEALDEGQIVPVAHLVEEPVTA